MPPNLDLLCGLAIRAIENFLRSDECDALIFAVDQLDDTAKGTGGFLARHVSDFLDSLGAARWVAALALLEGSEVGEASL